MCPGYAPTGRLVTVTTLVGRCPALMLSHTAVKPTAQDASGHYSMVSGPRSPRSGVHASGSYSEWMPGTNARLTVRGLVGSDGSAFVSLARMSLPFHRPWIKLPTDSNAFEQYVSRFDNEVSFGFVVCKDESIVAFINLTGIEREPYQRGRLGYGVFEQYANMGYMSFGLKKVVRLSFEKLGLHRLEADIQPSNELSRRLVQRNGFTCEGISRRFIHIDGKWMDHERWALTVDEWRHLDHLLSAHKPEQERQKCKEECTGIFSYLQLLYYSLSYPRLFSYGLSSDRTSRILSSQIGHGKYSYLIFSRLRRP